MAQWSGDTTDPVAAFTEQGREAAEVACHFYSNLSRALAECPGRAEDAGLIAWFASAGLRAGPGFEWSGLEPAQREGLTQGLAEAAELLASQARMRVPRPWVMSLRNGRYGTQYMARAVVAYIGLGALHPSEALYAASYFDAQLQVLDGTQHYTLHFDAAQVPPAEAFWSVTLYDADRFLYPNPMRRHAVGDRSRHLQRGPDGSLTLRIGHAAPANTANWLPAPAGRFYLVLRLYHPSEGAAHWRIPPLQAQA
jgi:hypothetical protein